MRPDLLFVAGIFALVGIVIAGFLARESTPDIEAEPPSVSSDDVAGCHARGLVAVRGVERAVVCVKEAK